MGTFAARSGPSGPGPQPWPRRHSCEPVTRVRDVCGLGPVPAALGSAASASWRARGVAVVLTSSSFSFSSDSQRQMGVQSKLCTLSRGPVPSISIGRTCAMRHLPPVPRTRLALHDRRGVRRI